MRPARRTAFSLLEVLLAAAILLGSLVVLGQLATVGRKHAHDAEKLTTAQMLCQTKLNEILAGVEPVRSVQDQALAEAPGWVYSVEIESLDQPGVASLRVTVAEDLPEPEEADGGPRAKKFGLTRWIRDPYGQNDVYGQSTESPDLESLLAPSLRQSFEEDRFGGDELP